MNEAEKVLMWVLDHTVVFVIPYMVWQTKGLMQVSQTIYGTKGDNGLNGTVRELRKSVTELEKEQGGLEERMVRHEGVFALHEQRMTGLDREIIQIRPLGHG